MSWLDNIKFDDKGLIPAIAQDHTTGRILMVAWQNKEALELTVKTKQAVYFSRSRQKLWHKGETSGHFQQVHDIRLDCDADVIILSVTQIGGIACHTGRQSCFYQLLTDNNGELSWQITDDVLKDPTEIYGDSKTQTSQQISNKHGDILTQLDTVLAERKNADPQSSYVASLYHKGINKILEKVGEETVETIIAGKDLQHEKSADNKNALIYEIADVWFHTLITLAWFNIPSSVILDELARRFGLSGIEEKANRQK